MQFTEGRRNVLIKARAKTGSLRTGAESGPSILGGSKDERTKPDATPTGHLAARDWKEHGWHSPDASYRRKDDAKVSLCKLGSSLGMEVEPKVSSIGGKAQPAYGWWLKQPVNTSHSE